MAQIVPAQPPRRHRGPIVLVVVLVLLVALVVGGDQVARVLAQSAAANRIQTRLQTPAAPSVQFRGFPFLTQVAAGRFQAVHVTADGAHLDVYEKAIQLTGIDATAYDVVATNGYQQITAGRADLSAVLPYASVSSLSGLQITGAADGLISTTFDLTVGGTQVSGTASGRPVLDVDAQRLSFSDVNVSVGNAADVTLADAAGQIVFAPIPVGQVPFGLRITAIEVRDDGIAISATGTNVPLRQ